MYASLRLGSHSGLALQKNADSRSLVSYDQPLPDATQDGAFPDTSPVDPLPILIRATNGKSKDRKTKRVKLSTVVNPDALSSFFERYADVCKAGMTTLKPRDRSKRKGKAKKRKGGANV